MATNPRLRNLSQDSVVDDTLPIDQSVMDAVASRDQGAMMLLYDRHSKLVYHIALRVLHDNAKAEDVVQDVFLHVWRYGGFRSEKGTVRAWLAVITRHRAIDIVRKKAREVSLDNEIESENSCHRRAEEAEYMQKLAFALPLMPEAQRVALRLSYFSGLTHAEISEKTGEPLGTIKTRIRLAMKYLRTVLECNL